MAELMILICDILIGYFPVYFNDPKPRLLKSIEHVRFIYTSVPVKNDLHGLIILYNPINAYCVYFGRSESAYWKV